MKRFVQLIPHIFICLFLSLCSSGSGNTPPVAVIDGVFKTYINEPILLNGSKSIDPDGDALGFYWEVTSAPSGSNPVIADAHSQTAQFIGDREGIYEVTLIVSDGKENSDPEIARITVFRDNLTPIADAGEDREIKITDTINLDGGASADPMNRRMTFSWSFKSKPGNSNAVIENNNSSVARFKPDVPHSIYEIQLIVSNGIFQSEPDTITISVINTRPVAEAGDNDTARPGEVRVLYGSGTDADGDVITGYSWHLVSHPGNDAYVYLENYNSRECTLHTDPTALGDYIIELKVYDGQDWSEPDVVIISTVNAPPNVDAGDDKNVAHCYSTYNTLGEYYATNDSGYPGPSCPGAEKLYLEGSASDPDGDPITYNWTTISTPQGAPLPTFQSPASPVTVVDIRSSSPVILGDYVFRLTASDNFGASSYDDVKITVTNRPPSSGGCTSGCNQTIPRLGCTAAGNLCYTQPIVSVSLTTNAEDPDSDPLFNEFYLAPNGGINCVYSNGVWCGNKQSCSSSLELRAFAFVGCSSSSTWAGTNTMGVRFKDGFNAQYDVPNNVVVTVNCTTCN